LVTSFTNLLYCDTYMESLDSLLNPQSSQLHAHDMAALYTTDEAGLASSLAQRVALQDTQDDEIEGRAANWVDAVRDKASSTSGVIDAFLQEYGLSTKEGVILMRLSEALIRTPDFSTAQQLMRDKLGAGSWQDHAGASPAALINTATFGLRFSTAWINVTGGSGASNLAAKLGDRVMHTAIVRGMGIMADHFVLGSTIEEAIARGKKDEAHGVVHSFDMLGEAARTAQDADRYFASYTHAANCLAKSAPAGGTVATSPGLSVKLSALHPRYEYANRAECVPILIEKVAALARIAKAGGIGLTLDAEEADRLELSLLIFDGLLQVSDLDEWDGLGIVVQAYQRRATAVINHLIYAAQAADRKIAIRLVKGAYWDMEIKRAQEMGLDSYPVFTRKEHTDVSYLACARRLLAAGNSVFPQFATHNAHTASAIIAMADGGTHLEFQRLHGMGAPLHAEIAKQTGIRSRVYAPVGNHKELLPYLVRRLLENGANSSFVNQLMNPDVAVDEIVRNPLTMATSRKFMPSPVIHDPRNMFGGSRQSARGLDLTQSDTSAAAEALLPLKELILASSIIDGAEHSKRAKTDGTPVYNPANIDNIVGYALPANPEDVAKAIASARQSECAIQTTYAQRSEVLMRMADALETNMPHLMAICVAEAGKSLPDAVAEIREAVDFCRYYALEATGPRMAVRKPAGVVVCISPWNFPLAIFVGQVAAAYAAGNSVLAKPAPQTPLIAFEAVKLFHQAGVGKDALHLIIGGPETGAMLTGSRDVDAICFTGSTPTAKRIAAARADIGMADTPLIAETGGINMMIVDSTALLEQAVGDVVASGFQSAGQRCSACRVVCVQEEVADDFEKMLSGAMQLLRIGNPAQLNTDVGPIIDADAKLRIENYVTQMRGQFRIIGEVPAAPANGHFIRPIAIAVDKVSDVKQEVFGPVLHVLRFKGEELGALIDQINALGFGLTMGLHTRIDARVQSVAAQAHVGNLYVNRNQIGAVVGVQPFGGEGLSGTGPKAGGPHYLLRLSRSDGQDYQNKCDIALAAYDDMTPQQCAALAVTLEKSRAAQKIWSSADRRETTEEFAEQLGLNTATDKQILRKYLDVVRQIVLPGPTGEENTLRLHPRGVMVVCGDEDAHDMLLQTIIALACGSTAIIPTDDAALRTALNQLQSLLSEQGLPKESIIIANAADQYNLITSDVDAVVADSNRRNSLAFTLNNAGGAIKPLLSLRDYPERFFHERTLTINTTAAGGNASLLIA
jgi:RHH-type transcriptional regulator, proline utilization regulon repressor / proline dehydrogenase / delta 1-pyrroline-5-carboxylate dehydrogenase